jgi:uncharacterized protein
MKFLTARWSNLFLATYPVPEELLRPRVPPGLELDRRDGHCFVSLVAFDFLETKVLGIPWPGFREFPELNLRFYVRHGEQRGVVFIRELVPKAFVAWVANTFYNERYVSTTMSSAIREDEREVTAVYRLDWAGRMHTITALGTKPAIHPSRDSAEHFFKEHEWGFNTSHKGKTNCYRVEHPPWDVYPLRSYEIDLDWAAVYGPEWKFLQDAQPYSVMLAAGSKVVVHSGQKLEEPVKPGK